MYCLGKRKGEWPCHHSGKLPIDRFQAEEVLSDIERSCRCTVCGWRRADVAPDGILATGSATLGPLLQATRSVPIVFVVVIDPVGAGYIASLATVLQLPAQPTTAAEADAQKRIASAS
jgi:hypothetical protein